MANNPFIALSKAAYNEENGEIISVDALNDLWAALINLPHWYILAHPSSSEEPRPFVASMDVEPEKTWAFIFTDTDTLVEFASKNGLVSPTGQCVFVQMNRSNAWNWLHSMGEQGLSGVRFNQGPHGWFSPIQNLNPILNHLQQLGKIQPSQA